MYHVKILDKLEEGKDHPLSYAKYTADDITYYIGSRPNCGSPTRAFFDSIDGWINVTDTPCWFTEKVNAMWFPWHEDRECAPEVLYSVIHTLTIWVKFKKLKTFYIHCDAGTHRSPTVFGAWLLGHYGRKRALEIVKTVELVERNINSDPITYIDEHLDLIPEDLILIKQTALTILNRYDAIARTIATRVKHRYQGDSEVYR